MYSIPRTTAAVTMIALVLHGSLPALAATGATIEGTVQVPSDPSRVSEVASVRIRPVSGGAAATVTVDPSTGAFRGPGLTEGEYELVAIGTDGEPLSPEPKRLLLRNGLNRVALSMQPPGSSDPQGAKKPRKKARLKNWHLTLIYVGVVAVIILALEDDDEDRASPVEP